MNTQVAARTAHMHSLKFSSQLKDELRVWDFLMALVPALAVPYVHDAIYASRGDWKTYVIPVLAVYSVGFVLYVLIRLPVLLWSWHKRLRYAKERIQSLESQLDKEHLEQLEDLSDAGHFWSFWNDHRTLAMWQNGSSKWSGSTSLRLGQYYGEKTAKAFDTFDGMDRSDATKLDLGYLNRRLENLRNIIQSLTSSSASRS